jgi:hypothetical protein
MSGSIIPIINLKSDIFQLTLVSVYFLLLPSATFLQVSHLFQLVMHLMFSLRFGKECERISETGKCWVYLICHFPPLCSEYLKKFIIFVAQLYLYCMHYERRPK